MGDFVKIPSQLEPLIPLSVLSLDLEPSTAGWAADLAAKGVAIELDDLGRTSISRADARRLFTEHRESLARHQEMAERAALEAEKVRLAELPAGIPWYEVPAGMSAAEAMVAAGGGDERPRRRSVIEDALDGRGTVMHILPPEPVES
jgi:hypothetical protein